MSLQQQVLDTIRAGGAMSNAEVRERLQLDVDMAMKVGTALRDGVNHGHLIKIPADAVTKQRYEAAPVTAAALALTITGATPASLRAEAIRLLQQAGNHTMPCAMHEKLLSLIAKAEMISSAPAAGSRKASAAR